MTPASFKDEPLPSLSAFPESSTEVTSPVRTSSASARRIIVSASFQERPETKNHRTSLSSLPVSTT